MLAERSSSSDPRSELPLTYFGGSWGGGEGWRERRERGGGEGERKKERLAAAVGVGVGECASCCVVLGGVSRN